MNDQADTQGAPEMDAANGNPTAGNPELSIPKHRFDEINARLRAREQEIQMKDQLLQQFSAQMRPQVQEPQGPTPEELGLDPQTYNSLQKLVQSQLLPERKRLEGLVAHQQNEMDVLRFLAEFGQDKVKHVDRIRQYQQHHAQTTGTFLPMAAAFKLMSYDESQRQPRRAPQTMEGQGAVTESPSPSYPSASGTRVQAPVTAPTKAAIAQMSVEEMEAALEERFRSEGSI